MNPLVLSGTTDAWGVGTAVGNIVTEVGPYVAIIVPVAIGLVVLKVGPKNVINMIKSMLA